MRSRISVLSILHVFMGMLSLGFSNLCWADVPLVRTVVPAGVQRGKTTEIELTGVQLRDAHQLLFFTPGIQATEVKPIDNQKVKVTIKADENAPCDLHAFRVVTHNGISNMRYLGVSPFESVEEVEPNSDRNSPQLLPMNRTVSGRIDSEDVDFFVVEVPQGEMINVEVEGLRHNYSNNLFDPYVAIYDEQGKELATSDDVPLVQQDSICGIMAPSSGRYFIEIRDSSFGGSRESFYRMHVGNFARPMAIVPSGGKPGEMLKATCIDVHGNIWEESFQLPSVPTERFRVWSTRGNGTPPSPNYLRVNAMENVIEVEPNEEAKGLTVHDQFPVALNGILQSPKDRDCFVIAAKKDQPIEIRLIGRNIIRSPIDGIIEVLNADGRRLASSDDAGSVDSALSFKAPADGQYTICIRDHMGKGGPHFAYRIELESPTPSLVTTIKEQERYIAQTIPIPRGARMAVSVILNRKFTSGKASIVVPDLPEGVEQVAAVVDEDQNIAQLLLRAKEEAPLGGKLVGLTAQSRHGKEGQEVLGKLDQRTMIVRGQNNRDVWGYNSDKMALAVVDSIPFDIEVVQPQVPLVRDGTLPLIVKCQRKPGFTGKVRLKLLETAPGVTASTAITIPEGKDVAEIPLTANAKAALGKFPYTVLASATVGQNDTVTIASEFVQVEVADRLFDFQFAKTMAEQGKTADVVVAVELARPVDGKVEVEIVGLPPGTTMEKTKLPLNGNNQKLTYQLKIPSSVRPGSYKTMAFRGTVTSDKGVITQVNGTAEVQVDLPRPESDRGKGKKSEVGKKLTSLEQNRTQREENN